MATKRNLALAKLTGLILAIYLLFSWLWIELIALSHQQNEPSRLNPIEALQQRPDNRPFTSQTAIQLQGKSELEAEVPDDPQLSAALASINKDPTVNNVSVSFLINNEHICCCSDVVQNSPDDDVIKRKSPDNAAAATTAVRVFLFVYIHSAPENYVKRLLLRQTWLRPALYAEHRVRYAFFMGRRANEEGVNQAIQLESQQFNDIVQGNFEDTYHNLNTKSLSAAHWISSYCNKTRYVLKTDDDAFVNMRALLRHLSDLDRADQPQRPQKLIMCRIWYDMHVVRNGSKWSVPRELYAPDFYPPYCSGIAWIMTSDIVRVLPSVASKTKMFWIDDVYITGMLIARLQDAGAKLNAVSFGHTYIYKDKMETFDGPLWYRYLFVHLPDTIYFNQMWKRMESIAQRYKIPPVDHVEPGRIAGQL